MTVGSSFFFLGHLLELFWLRAKTLRSTAVSHSSLHICSMSWSPIATGTFWRPPGQHIHSQSKHSYLSVLQGIGTKFPSIPKPEQAQEIISFSIPALNLSSVISHCQHLPQCRHWSQMLSWHPVSPLHSVLYFTQSLNLTFRSHCLTLKLQRYQHFLIARR